MRPPELGGIYPSIGEQDLETDRSAIRKRWWNLFSRIDQEAHDSRIEVKRYGLKGWVLVGDTNEFSTELTNAQLADLVAEQEAKNHSIGADVPYSQWSPEVRKEISAAMPTGYWAKVVSNNLSLRALAVQIIDILGTEFGFESRYWQPLQNTPEKIEERSVVIGAFLLQRLLKEKKWNGVDAILVSSAVLPADISIRILAYAKEIGILPADCLPELRDIRTGCAGAAVAFGMMNTDPLLRETERAVVLALDPLLDVTGIRPDLISFKHFASLFQFGNGFAGVAVRPNKMKMKKAHLHIQEQDADMPIMYVPQNNPGVPIFMSRWLNNDNLKSNLNRITWSSDPEHKHLAVTQEHKIASQEDVQSTTNQSENKILPMIVKVFHAVLKENAADLEISPEDTGVVSNVPNRKSIGLFDTIARRYRLKGPTFTAKRRANSSSASLLRNMLDQEMQQTFRKVIMFTTAVGVMAGVFVFELAESKK